MKHIKYLFPILALAACGSSDDDHTAVVKDTAAALHVTIAQAGNTSTGSNINISGQLVSEHSAAISTRMMGYITKMNVNIGDNVHSGQLLFSVKSTDIQAKGGQVSANIAAADAALANAQKDYERFKTLHAQNSATDKELENMALQYKAAAAQAQAARQMRNEVNANMPYANVTAPFSGTVTQKMMDAGGLASPGMPVLMLESSGALQATASVTENQIRYVHQGMRVTVSTDADGKNIAGTVAQISRSSIATGGQYLIKINLDNSQGLLSGMYVHINIPVSGTVAVGESATVTIPQESLVTQGELVGVYTVSEDKKALLRWLRTGSNAKGQVEVLSGLSNGEKYISKADSRLWNGVRIVEN